MARLIISIFLLIYAGSNLAHAAVALADLSESSQIAHELHGMNHDLASEHDQNHDEQYEDQANHYCSHNLVALEYASLTAHRKDAMTLVVANASDPHYSKLHERLLRPPRN